MDLLELANHLRLEHLFVTTEKHELQTLYEKLIKCTEDVFHISWIRQKQIFNLHRLMSLNEDSISSNYFFTANALENVNFVDSYKKLFSNVQLFSDLLSQLRKNPKIVALCLIEMELQFNQIELQAISTTIFSSLYCDCILPEDQQLTLLLLKELVNNQLSLSDNPLKLIKNGNCAFKRMFKLFTESIITSKFFLTSALRDAIFNCLMEDELYLDIDPERAAMRYSDGEREKLFGSSLDKINYENKLCRHRVKVIEKLSSIVQTFIDGIQNSINCFPNLLHALLKHIYQSLNQSKNVDEKETNVICSDLIFGQFICHAIINPEFYGIVDINITKIARFNLTQVAQIIQILSLNKYQDFDHKLNDLFVKIPRTSLNSVIEILIDNEGNEDCSQFNYFNNFNSLAICNDIKRTCTLFSEKELYHFIRFLHKIKHISKNQHLKKVLENLLQSISESTLDKILNESCTEQQQQKIAHSFSYNADEIFISEEIISAITCQPNTKSVTTKKSLLDKVSRSKDEDNSKSNKKSLLNKVSKKACKSLSSSPSNNTLLSMDNVENIESLSSNLSYLFQDATKNSNNNFNNLTLKNNNLQVLVIPISNANNNLCSGILSEDKVLNLETQKRTKNKNKDISEVQSFIETKVPSTTNNLVSSILEKNNSIVGSNLDTSNLDQKRNKFVGLSQDQESVCTNENLEVISETSSNENINDNLLIEVDNLSDMISANVSSGRATPNVSGRDTPSSSSQTENGEDPCDQINGLNNIPLVRDMCMNSNTLNDLQSNYENINGLNINQNLLNREVNGVINLNENIDNVNCTLNHLNQSQRTQDYIEDKFGKFDYKMTNFSQPTDEVKSHLSETWSTDVLTSISSMSVLSNQTSDLNQSIFLQETVNFESCKKILRHVFNNVDIQNTPILLTNSIKYNFNGKLKQVLNLLQLLHAEAKYMQNLNHAIAIQEAIRCLNNFDENMFTKLLYELKDDYQKRSAYVAYLVKCKQSFISAITHFETIQNHLKQDKKVINYCLIMIYVKSFLEQKKTDLDLFVEKFKQLTLADEKAHLVEEFLCELYESLESEANWQLANEHQLQFAKLVIERNIFTLIYFNALCPNGEGDVLRDQILCKHIQNLQKIVTLDHKDLKIPKHHHNECPWPSAQEHIIKLNAYKTPRDKVNCVFNCCSVIMNLLSLCDKQVPAADDLMPVLVFVLIKANPPSLLSTIDFINSYYEKKLEGEQAYWWTQFCSAVAFVKTMDY